MAFATSISTLVLRSKSLRIQAGSGAHRPPASASRQPLYYRLLHSSGEHFIKDRDQAVHRLASLPGAKLFVLQEAAPAVK